MKEYVSVSTNNKLDRTFESANAETLGDPNRENNEGPHKNPRKNHHEDSAVINEVQDKEPEEILGGEPDPVTIDKPELQAYDPPKSLTKGRPKLQVYDGPDAQMHGKSEIQTCNKPKFEIHKTPEFQINDKPELEIQDKPVLESHNKSELQTFERSELKTDNEPEIKILDHIKIHKYNIPVWKQKTTVSNSENITNNEKGFEKNNQYNDIDKQYKNNTEEILEDNKSKKSSFVLIKNDMKYEAYLDATFTTKKSHIIPKPSTPLIKPQDISQNVFENELKTTVEYNTDRKIVNSRTKHKSKAIKKRRKDNTDESQLVNFKDVHTSNDNNRVKNILMKPVKPLGKHKHRISEENISVNFKKIYNKKIASKVSKVTFDVNWTPTAENNDESVAILTEYDEGSLKSYYTRGKLITAQAVNNIIEGKNTPMRYTNEMRFRRNLDESIPESIEPNTGELVKDDVRIADYDPVDGTIDGLGPVKKDKNIKINNKTRTKKHHHHHNHKHHHHKNKTGQDRKKEHEIGFPGNLADFFIKTPPKI